MAAPAWRLFIHRLPTEPSRHRVAVWRELRRAGAVPLQQATWAIPTGEGFDEAVERASGLVERGGGTAFVLDVTPGSATDGRLEHLYTAAREEEWGEFLGECGKFDAEIAGEIAKEKFTLAELDEEEQNLERLRRWHRQIRARDLFSAPSAEEAERCLKASTEVLEDFAERVFRARER